MDRYIKRDYWQHTYSVTMQYTENIALFETSLDVIMHGAPDIFLTRR